MIIDINVNFRLKLIEVDDIEELRLWKNKHKESFFLKKDITPEEQIKWFEFYERDKENFMFVVQEGVDNYYIIVGCMGYRVKDNIVDVYNIMRGKRNKDSCNSMATAFTTMNVYISCKYKYDITCKVLNNNPARHWYEKLNFETTNQLSEYSEYKLNIKIGVNS